MPGKSVFANANVDQHTSPTHTHTDINADTHADTTADTDSDTSDVTVRHAPHAGGLSIIAEGGGMRGGYVLGVLDALVSHYGLRRADVVSGSSASIGTLSYFVAGQFHYGFRIWTEQLQNPRVLSPLNLLRGRPVLDIDYIVDEVLKKQVPLDVDTIRGSDTTVIVPVTNATTGDPEYFDNHDELDYFELLRAAMAIPLFYGGTVRLGDEYYFDGGAGDPIPLDHPLLEGTHKIVITTQHEPYLQVSPLIERLVFLAARTTMTAAMYRSLAEHRQVYHNRVLEAKGLAAAFLGDRGGQCGADSERAGSERAGSERADAGTADTEAVLVQPHERFSLIDNSRTHIARSIAVGRNDALASEPLRRLITELKQSPRAAAYFSPEALVDDGPDPCSEE